MYHTTPSPSPSASNLPWTLSTDQNAWLAAPAPMWTASPVYPAYPAPPAIVEGIPTYGRYENVYAAPPMVPAMAPMPPMQPMPAMPVSYPHPMVNPEDFVAVTSANWSNAVMTQSQQQAALQKKKTFAQVVIEDQLNSQSLYKTELCRSFEETGTCRYGMKCQFAHGKDELRPVLRHPKYKTEICRTFHSTGTCPYGKRCRFIHQSADEANLNAINVIPWSRNMEQNSSDESEASTSSSGEDVADLADQFNTLELEAPVEQKIQEEEKAKVSSKSKSKTEKTKSQKSDSSEKKKSSKRRLAFFARLSGDTSSNAQPQ